MSIDRTYKCNLCQTRHEPNSPVLHGIYWKALLGWTLVGVRESENHLCLSCMDSIRKFDLPVAEKGE